MSHPINLKLIYKNFYLIFSLPYNESDMIRDKYGAVVIGSGPNGYGVTSCVCFKFDLVSFVYLIHLVKAIFL